METLVLKEHIDFREHPEERKKERENNLKKAAEILREGGLVAVPTETVYGLAGNGTDERVIEKIYEVKGRPSVKPLPLMVSGPESIRRFCPEAPDLALRLAERFWPGPLTLVLPSGPEIPKLLRAGGKTVGLRCPRKEETLSLLRALDFPLAVPSANLSGEKSPTSAEEVLKVFDGKIEAVIDGGACDLGEASTVLDLSVRPPVILRQGALPEKMIREAIAAFQSDMLQENSADDTGKTEDMTEMKEMTAIEDKTSAEEQHKTRWNNTRLIGITGGSGSGKTSVLRLLEEQGALVIDADEVYHELLESSESLRAELAEAFPSAVDEKGVDRKKLAAIVFHDPQSLQTLNHISHRYVREAVSALIDIYNDRGGGLAALDAVELFSEGTAELPFVLTMAVEAPRTVRLRRIMERDGIGEAEALRRLSAQKSEERFAEDCDLRIRNDGSEEELREKIMKILEENKLL